MTDGPTFRTANGSLRFWQFGELVSRMWNDSHSASPMYQKGALTDDVEYPSLIWSCGGKKKSDRSPLKPRKTDEFRDADGAYSIYADWFDCIFEVEVRASNPLEANQLEDVFEDFMLEFIGAIKKLGAFEIFFLQRLADTVETRAGRPVPTMRVQYMMVEQKTRVVSEGMIEAVELHARAITQTVESEEIVSLIDNT
jgi:hypothetical protein